MLRSEESPEAEAREENLGQLLARMTEFVETRDDASLESFLEEVALMTPQDETEEDRQTLTMMTLHMAKGLEFAFFIQDVMVQNYPFRDFYSAALKEWSLPLWHPGINCGFPLFAEGQAGVLPLDTVGAFPWCVWTDHKIAAIQAFGDQRKSPLHEGAHTVCICRR